VSLQRERPAIAARVCVLVAQTPRFLSDERRQSVILRPSRTLHRCLSIGPVLLHELTFCTLRSSRTMRSGSPACFQAHRRVPVGNRFPPKRSAKASASSGLAKQNTTKSLLSRRRECVSGVADRTSGSAKYHLTVDGLPHFFGRERHVMGPFAASSRHQRIVSDPEKDVRA
jgi:hypothetical protein